MDILFWIVFNKENKLVLLEIFTRQIKIMGPIVTIVKISALVNSNNMIHMTMVSYNLIRTILICYFDNLV